MFVSFWMNAPCTSELYCGCFGNPYCLSLQGVVPPWLLHYIQCMPTIRSPSDGQWRQKENIILEEPLCSYWGGEEVECMGILHGSCWQEQ